jgi:hypothetical protein
MDSSGNLSQRRQLSGNNECRKDTQKEHECFTLLKECSRPSQTQADGNHASQDSSSRIKAPDNTPNPPIILPTAPKRLHLMSNCSRVGIAHTTHNVRNILSSPPDPIKFPFNETSTTIHN